MNITETKIPGAIVLEPKVFGDERGFFMETWHQSRYEEAGLPTHFVQDNLSFSQKGVLRGLHFQNPDQQGKLVQVFQGEVFDVAVDIRVGSPTFGEWEAVLLSSENKRQFYVPEGCAHGFLTLEDASEIAYQISAEYHPATGRGVRWNDPAFGIAWPEPVVVISERDANYPDYRR